MSDLLFFIMLGYAAFGLAGYFSVILEHELRSLKDYVILMIVFIVVGPFIMIIGTINAFRKGKL